MIHQHCGGIPDDGQLLGTGVLEVPGSALPHHLVNLPDRSLVVSAAVECVIADPEAVPARNRSRPRGTTPAGIGGGQPGWSATGILLGIVVLTQWLAAAAEGKKIAVNCPDGVNPLQVVPSNVREGGEGMLGQSLPAAAWTSFD